MSNVYIWNDIYFGEKNSAGAVERAVEIYSIDSTQFRIRNVTFFLNLQFFQLLNRTFSLTFSKN